MALVSALVVLMHATIASAQAGTVTVSNVTANCAGGYAFTVNGSGLPADADLYVWVFDNVFPRPAGQLNPVRTDATGGFTLDFSAPGASQRLPATVEVTDMSGTVVAGPVTVNPVACTTPARPDLVVTKTTTATTVGVGNSITYSIVVKNQGTAAASNVELTDELAGPATISSMTPSAGTCTPPICSLGTIAVGQSVTVTVVVTTTEADIVSNSATATTTDVESDNTNNTGSASDVTVNDLGCNAVGRVHANQNWKMPSGRKSATVHVEVDADCDYDRKMQMVYLHHAKVKIHVDGRTVLASKSNDRRNEVQSVTIVGQSDAVIRGIDRDGGARYTITLHDGGRGSKNDNVQVVVTDTGDPPNVLFDSSLLSCPHGNVHIDNR